jgi:hypothetical protein
MPRGASSLLQVEYRGSLTKALANIYPDYPWQIWRFEQVPKGFWNDMKNQRDFLNWFGKEMGILQQSDWYRIRVTDFAQRRGIDLLHMYRHFIGKMLEAIFPEFHWQMWRFERVPKNFWDKEDHVKEYLTWLADKLQIEILEDWHKISREQLQPFKTVSLLMKYGGLIPLLAKHFPSNNWDLPRRPTLAKTQSHLFK